MRSALCIMRRVDGHGPVNAVCGLQVGRGHPFRVATDGGMGNARLVASACSISHTAERYGLGLFLAPRPLYFAFCQVGLDRRRGKD